MTAVTTAVRTGPRPGTASAAFRYRDFRIMWLGFFGSNLGTWMQNAVLAKYVYNLTGSTLYGGLVYFAQLGSTLVLSMPAGAYADRTDRRRLLMVAQWVQLAFSVLLAVVVVALDGDLRLVAIPACVLFVGIGTTFQMPAWSSMIAEMVGPADLRGAVSLGFLQLNLARVLGPFAGIVLFNQFGASSVFLVNAATYVIAVVALSAISSLPPQNPMRAPLRRRMREGIAYVRGDAVQRWVVGLVFVMSLMCLPFLSQMPAIAEERFGITGKSGAYAWLNAMFGVGAAIGAISVGTVLSHRKTVPLVRFSFCCLALATVGLALTPSHASGYPLLIALGAAYFTAVTAASSALQQQLTNEMRGRVMAIYAMAFGGTVPFGALLSGAIAQVFDVRVMLLVGAVCSVALGLYRPAGVDV